MLYVHLGSAMDQPVDLAKLVGAASAPVALIISTCIYLGNMITRYNVLYQQITDFSEELRGKVEPPERAKSIQDQLRLSERRMDGTMKCTFWLNVAIICFVFTVLFTGLSMLAPKNMVFIAITAGVMAIGLLIVAYSILIELWYGRLAKPTLDTELTSGTPQYEPEIAGRRS